MSTSFDSGAIVGSLLLGFLSDKFYGKRSPVTLIAILMSAALCYAITFTYWKVSKGGLFALIFFFGLFVSGLVNLINGSVAADLGKQSALKENKKSLVMVASIVDGSGALGSSIGQLIIGATKKAWGWQYGYWMVLSVDISLTLIPLSKILYEEISELRAIYQSVIE